jgi:hypothetical protein
MAHQICTSNYEGKLHMAGKQQDLFSEILAYTEVLSWTRYLNLTVQFLWLSVILGELKATWRLFVAVSNCHRNKSCTRIVVADAINDDSDHSNEVSDDRSEDSVDLGDAMTVVRMSIVWRWRYVCFCFGVILPKLVLALMLYWRGVKWLSTTINFNDLILNAVALAFVLDFDEALFSVFVPIRIHTLIANFEPLPVGMTCSSDRLSKVRRAKPAACSFAIMIAVIVEMWFVWAIYIYPVETSVNQAKNILCSGATQFIYAKNPATGIVHYSGTVGNSNFTVTESVIAQIAQPTITIDFEQKGTDILEWMGVDVPRAVQEAAPLCTEEPCPDGSSMREPSENSKSFDHVLDMDLWSIGDAAGSLPCRDLASGEASKGALREIMNMPELDSCRDVPPHICANISFASLRAVCPQHCRCEERATASNTGFFGTSHYGCPSQCNTFKSVSNEILFRYDLNFETDGESRTSCADSGNAVFTFPGGCADNDTTTQRDKRGKGCASYVQSDCDAYDDADFLSSSLCCICGGGEPSVPSSVQCWDDFSEACLKMPREPLSWLLYVQGLFEHLTSSPTFEDNVRNVVSRDYPGFNGGRNGSVVEDHTRQLVDHIMTAGLGRMLVNATWAIMHDQPHPRGLTGCEFLASYELTSLINMNLCSSEAKHTSIRFWCPVTCGCDESNALDECPAGCVLKKCVEKPDKCSHAHPWFGEECTVGAFKEAGSSSCIACFGDVRRRRANRCTRCDNGTFDDGSQGIDECQAEIGSLTTVAVESSWSSGNVLTALSASTHSLGSCSA